jgi:inhibitor of the pro-sigma K processing machinery
MGVKEIAVIALVAVVVVFLVAQWFRGSMKILWLLIRNAAIGLSGLFVINYIGNSFHFHIGVNGFTAIVASILGIPGLIALLVMKLWFFSD